MSRQQSFTPDHLFDRPWRPGRRFTPRAGRVRRIAMFLLLAVLCLIIGAYTYLTDADRVRGMAEQYLSSLVGGPVKVGGATLSVFEGLRLDDVRVYVDDQKTSPDSLLFSAQTFVIKYDPRTMIAGRLEATQIVAQKPQVHLAENRDVGEWNYERLARRRRHAPAGPPGVPGKPRVLPEVLLRNARVVISEIRGGQEVARGLMAVDGRLAATASDADRYAFHLQSRGTSEGIGPYATGSVSLSTGNVVARLMNFEFDRDIRSMLPVEPREWWQRHELAGAVSMPEISFTPGKAGKTEQFKLVTVLNGVTLSVSPEEWMGRAEVGRLASMRQTAGMMGALYASAGKTRSPYDVAGDFAATGAQPLTTPDRFEQLLRPTKITLKNVAGTFVFTNAGIEVKDVSGFIESNGLKINGHIDGYRPDATMALQLASFDTENLTIPASPRYINSLPREVREVYEQFRPEGEARIAVRVDRSEAGARPEVAGSIQILDGRFVFNRFAYPLRNVTGRIEFGRGTDGVGRLSLNVRGNGPVNGPNRDAVMEIKTFGDGIAPIGTNVCGVNVRISGTNVASDDALRDAFAPEVRQALTQFDAHKTGKYPQYRGDFVTEVVRPEGLNQRWSFDTDIKLTGASGALVAFPYPLHDLAGTLRIRNGYADVVDLHMTRGSGDGAANLAVNGRFAWTTSDGPRGPQPPHRARDAQLSPRVDESVATALDVRVRNMPVDNDLLAAIPADARAWIKRLGATGRLDVDGRVFPSENKQPGGKVEWVVGGQERQPAPLATAQDVGPAAVERPGPPMGYDLKLTVRDGKLRPFGGTFEATDVAATMRLTQDQLAIERVTGRRGESTLSTTGNIEWAHGKPRVVLDGTGTALALDAPLYELLPDAAKHAWDETQPEGTLDATVHYDSAALEAERSGSLAGQDAPPAQGTVPATPGVRVELKPRKLAVTLKSTPYRLDELTGAVTVAGNRVTIDDVTGKHGDAKVSVAGTGVLGNATQVWDLRVAGDGLPVDDDLRKALPTTLAGLAEAIKLQGKVGFNLTRFVHRSAQAPTEVKIDETAVTQPAAAPPATPEPEIDIAGSFNLAGASIDVGVPLAEVVGAVNIDAAVRNGHLDTLRGFIDFDSMSMAGRPAKSFRADLFKPAGRGELSFTKMRGQIAGGTMSGRMTLVYPEDDDNAASRYALELVVRDADVKALAWETEDAKMEGRLTASLNLEGSWGDAAQRRGRGDVMVAGKELKRIPLVLGLLQVTNLALPISSPFNEATAVYSLDGSRVIFERIRLKAPTMLMEGNGSLDFTDKRVDLSFTTDNPSGLLNIPFIKDIWRGARNEMLKINVRGTIQEPEVSAESMGTLWTTVDEVFNGDRRADVSEKKRKPK